MSWQLIVELLREKADNHKTVAKLWATDPEAYGIDDLGIADWNGQGNGLAFAADLIEKHVVDKEGT